MSKLMTLLYKNKCGRHINIDRYMLYLFWLETKNIGSLNVTQIKSYWLQQILENQSKLLVDTIHHRWRTFEPKVWTVPTTIDDT